MKSYLLCIFFENKISKLWICWRGWAKKGAFQGGRGHFYSGVELYPNIYNTGKYVTYAYISIWVTTYCHSKYMKHYVII